MKTEVSFHCTRFNCTESKDYFINDCCFGDDVCRWMMGELRARGFQTGDEPGQEDFGWYFTFHAGDAEHCFVIGFQPNDPATGDRWLGSLERQTGFFASLFGGRKQNISPDAVDAIRAILESSPDIRQISWHKPGTDPEDDARGAPGEAS